MVALSRMRILLAGLIACSTSGCASAVLAVGEATHVLIHVDDTPAEREAYLVRRLARLDKWCRQEERSACDRANALRLDRDKVALESAGATSGH